MKRKGIFSKFTASVMSALIVLGGASAAQPFAPVIFDGITVSADDTIPLTNMSELGSSRSSWPKIAGRRSTTT